MPTSDSLTNLVREVLTHHILQVSRDPMFVVDGDNRILVANRAAEHLGWGEGQLTGRRWDDLVVTDDTTVAHIASSNVTDSAPGVAIARQATLRLADGSRESVRLLTYRLWLGSSTAPSVVIVERRPPAPVAPMFDTARVTCGALDR